MKSQKYKSICNCQHEKKAITEINSKFSLCFNCSSIIYTKELGQEISTIKPSKFSVMQETSTPIFLTISEHTPYTFRNKSGFLKTRNSFVKYMKKFCNDFKLSKKTFFLSLDYFDRICSKMNSFNKDDLLQISQICIILASKFQESQIKTLEMRSYLGLSNNYSKDELYLLQLLDYDLLVHTSYDILVDIMHTGFLFNDEKFSLKKMNFIYGKMENMLYFFTETKLYIDMTYKEIALALIGFIRQTLGLTAYNNILKYILMNEYNDIQNYYHCLEKFGKFFNIKDNNNHSDSNTDSNSDNNSENSLDIKNDNCDVKNSLIKDN
jgi:hypothetical protein